MVKTSEVKYATFGMFFFILTCRCIIVWMPSLGLPWISTLLVGLGDLCILICLYYAIKTRLLVFSNLFNFLYVVYVFYIINDLFVNRQLSIDSMAAIPDSMFNFTQSSVLLFIMMSSSKLYSKYVDFVKLAKVSCFVILAFMIIYQMQVGFAWSGMFYGMRMDDVDALKPTGYIDGLLMNNFIGLLFASNLYLHNKWTQKRILNIFITSVISFICFIIQFMLVERGPILFQVVTILIFLYAKGVANNKYLIHIIIVSFVLYLFSDMIIRQLTILSPQMIEKITGDVTGSGRLGDDSSIFNLSIKQIMQAPVFGSYCRITISPWVGMFPHNIVLEFIMTFGLFFSIPMFYLMVKAFVQSVKMIQNNTRDSLFGLIYIFTTLCLTTSGTVLSKTVFWLSLAYIINTYKSTKNIEYE